MRSTRSAKLHGLRFVALIGLALLAVAPVLGHGDRGPAHNGCEPRLPLEVKLRALEADPASPGLVLSLDLAAKTDLAAVRFELLLPEEIRLLDRLDSGGFRLDRGERMSLPFHVACGGPATVQVRVTAVTTGGLSFSRGASLELDGDGRPVLRGPGGTVRHSPDGNRTVREFPARSAAEAGR